MLRFLAALFLFCLMLTSAASASDQVDRLALLARTMNLSDFLHQRAEWDAEYAITSDEALVMTDLGFAADRVLGVLPGLTASFCRAHHLQIRAAQAQEKGVEAPVELWTTFFSLEPKVQAPFLNADVTFSQAAGKVLTLTFTVSDEGLADVHQYFAHRMGDAEAVFPIKTGFRGKPHPETREPGYCLVRSSPGEKLLHYHFPLPDMPQVGLNLFTLVFIDAFREYLEAAEALKPADARELQTGCESWVEQMTSEYARAGFNDGLRASSGDLLLDLTGKWRQPGDDAVLELRLNGDAPYVIAGSGSRIALLNIRADGPDAVLAETKEKTLLRFERVFHPILLDRHHLIVYTAQDGDLRRADYYD